MSLCDSCIEGQHCLRRTRQFFKFKSVIQCGKYIKKTDDLSVGFVNTV